MLPWHVFDETSGSLVAQRRWVFAACTVYGLLCSRVAVNWFLLFGLREECNMCERCESVVGLARLALKAN